jgi:hypothetical protein
MEVTNTLAYYDTAEKTAVKSFLKQAPGLDILGKICKKKWQEQIDMSVLQN